VETNYFSNHVKNLVWNHTIQRHWETVNEVTGRFNNVMYQLYSILVILVTLKWSSTEFFLLGLCPHICIIVVLCPQGC